jgi:putative FmdB family regulatory protein
MPTYEYRCPRGHEFERFYKTMSGAAMELPCPECQEIASRQLSGGAGLHFKGSGFYLTDYGKNAHRSSADGKKAEGQKAEGSKGEGSKGEGSKGEGSKGEGSKGEDSKAGTKSAPTTQSSGAKADSSKPTSDTSKKPKSE